MSTGTPPAHVAAAKSLRERLEAKRQARLAARPSSASPEPAAPAKSPASLASSPRSASPVLSPAHSPRPAVFSLDDDAGWHVDRRTAVERSRREYSSTMARRSSSVGSGDGVPELRRADSPVDQNVPRAPLDGTMPPPPPPQGHGAGGSGDDDDGFWGSIGSAFDRFSAEMRGKLAFGDARPSEEPRGHMEAERAYEVIAKLFKDLFSEVPLSTLEILAGLLLIRKLHGHVNSVHALSKLRERDAHDATAEEIQRLYHWWTYAAAAYGSRVLRDRLGQYGLTLPTDVTGDELERKTLLSYLSLGEDDLLMFSPTASLYRPAFFLAVSRKTKHVALVIRGTMDVRDAMTDVVATYVDIGDGGLAHEGMLRAAEWFVDNVVPVLKRGLRDFPGYAPVVVGHSLGAGVATLVTYLLRNEMPELHCFAFASPGVLSSNIADSHWAIRCVTTMVVRDDIVARLSIGHVEDLKKVILHLSQREDNLFRQVYNVVQAEHSHLGGERAAAPAHAHGKRSYRRLSDDDETGASANAVVVDLSLPIEMQARKLYPAGRILHFVAVPLPGAAPLFRVRVRAAPYFAEIILCDDPIEDHMPESYEMVLRSVLDEVAAGGDLTASPK